MVGLNVLIKDENNAILIDYAKKIGLVMKGMQISIIEKWHCKMEIKVGEVYWWEGQLGRGWM